MKMASGKHESIKTDSSLIDCVLKKNSFTNQCVCVHFFFVCVDYLLTENALNFFPQNVRVWFEHKSHKEMKIIANPLP